MHSPSQRKVLHLINGEFYAGGERVQDLLALRLPEFGYDVSWVCLKPGIFDAKRMARQVPLATLAMSSDVDLRAAGKVAAMARDGDFAFIHTHTRRAALIGALASLKSGVPMVHHLHSPSASDTEQKLRNLKNALVEKASLARARRIIPVSQSLARYLVERGYDTSRISQVNNGVPITNRCAVPHCASAELVIGTVALFRPRKGIEVLLKALARVREQGLAVRLRAVGPFETQSYQREIVALVDKLGLAGQVDWTGFTSDVGAELAQMQIFVLPSLFGEGMPMVILEAMAAGLPVISSDVEGIPEVVRQGVDGLVVAPDDVSALAAALQQVVSDRTRLQSMGAAARERQQQAFSDRSMAAGVAAVYDDLLAAGADR